MPICRRCNNKFRTKCIIDGKKRNLRNRKYCLDCSPFGLHNTRILEDKLKPHCKNCKKCGKSSTRSVCGACNVRERKKKLKMMAVEYKGGKCEICGYSKCITALHFHHKDPSEKDFSIAGQTRGWEKIRKEIDKCMILCANCHSEIHSGMVN